MRRRGVNSLLFPLSRGRGAACKKILGALLEPYLKRRRVLTKCSSSPSPFFPSFSSLEPSKTKQKQNAEPHDVLVFVLRSYSTSALFGAFIEMRRGRKKGKWEKQETLSRPGCSHSPSPS
jgi:hypothetical protein